MPLYMDTMDNLFLKQYGAWPTQLYLFHGGTLKHKVTPYLATFDIVEFFQTAQRIVVSSDTN
eukprot:m.75478 g.75478  ORF g.75478 m.75478 type:complete len:62 (+) comp10419_c0_seq1:1277-1462(+)